MAIVELTTQKAVEEVQWAALGMPRPQLLGGATTP
jgi:hypothetical protein